MYINVCIYIYIYMSEFHDRIINIEVATGMKSSDDYQQHTDEV
jgi:hypothetical protein